ncbi:hypothetical protein HPB50_019675 [Hyalomma asiaticum]|uniref:Uncharacterized protein n=1 Tax=Hyalomma asiaticum TaxID=266040 RepID=A0ACB7T087_HYAAI|nr:hypothetical protein HPB50_019675 [Hyalomma asiaticum]
MRLSRIRLRLNNASFSGFLYDYVIDYMRPYIEAKVESVISRTWNKALRSAASYLALIRGQHPSVPRGGDSDEESTPRRPLPERQRVPRSAEVERERGVFDGALRGLVLSRGFDPMPLPDNVGDLDFSFGRITVHEGNLTGLSSVYRSGDCALVLGDCGLALRLDLGFQNLLVRAIASINDRSNTRTTVLDMLIPALEMELDIAEVVCTIQSHRRTLRDQTVYRSRSSTTDQRCQQVWHLDHARSQPFVPEPYFARPGTSRLTRNGSVTVGTVETGSR